MLEYVNMYDVVTVEWKIPDREPVSCMFSSSIHISEWNLCEWLPVFLLQSSFSCGLFISQVVTNNNTDDKLV